MVYILPCQVAHDVSCSEADALIVELRPILPVGTIIRAFALFGKIDRYAVIVVVQDKEFLPPKHDWATGDLSAFQKEYKGHVQKVQETFRKLHAFMANKPNRCSYDTRLAVCMPFIDAPNYLNDLWEVGHVSKHQRSRCVLLNDGAIMATLLDMRYVNSINYHEAPILEDLFNGKSTLSQFLCVMPLAEPIAYDPRTDVFHDPMTKAPWFQGSLVLKPYTEEEKVENRILCEVAIKRYEQEAADLFEQAATLVGLAESTIQSADGLEPSAEEVQAMIRARSSLAAKREKDAAYCLRRAADLKVEAESIDHVVYKESTEFNGLPSVADVWRMMPPSRPQCF
jgi:hypothetical protein